MNYDLTSIKVNNTTAFLVPPLGISRDTLKANGFVGAYLGDVNKPDISYKRGIFMLFKPRNIEFFEEFLETEKIRTFNIMEDYDYEGGYIVVVYALDDGFSEDYEKFLKGQYSKFSKKFKQHFPKTVSVRSALGKTTDEIPWQQKVFRKDREFREYWEEEFGVAFDNDMEVWGVPVMDKELLNIEEIKKE